MSGIPASRHPFARRWLCRSWTERCAGLDVHQKTVVACVLTPDGQGGWDQETHTFGAMTAELLALSDWLLAYGCTHVAIESTGDYWKPVCHNILEGICEVLLVNAQHVKAVPGRKTDVKDAAWLAELLQHGLLRASFIPPVAQRELRDLTRYRRTCIQERVTLINRVQQLLDDANIKLAAVAADIMGGLRPHDAGGTGRRPYGSPRPSRRGERPLAQQAGTVGEGVGRAGQTASSVCADGAVMPNR